jgi:hypothetical protein
MKVKKWYKVVGALAILVVMVSFGAFAPTSCNVSGSMSLRLADEAGKIASYSG